MPRVVAIQLRILLRLEVDHVERVDGEAAALREESQLGLVCSRLCRPYGP
jgi:hypothetical protein